MNKILGQFYVKKSWIWSEQILFWAQNMQGNHRTSSKWIRFGPKLYWKIMNLVKINQTYRTKIWYTTIEHHQYESDFGPNICWKIVSSVKAHLILSTKFCKKPYTTIKRNQIWAITVSKNHEFDRIKFDFEHKKMISKHWTPSIWIRLEDKTYLTNMNLVKISQTLSSKKW